MIVWVAASSVLLTMLQASINAPTNAFRGCLKEAATKATNEKVGADGIEAYLRNTCSASMDSLKSSVVAFRTKNGMSKKAAASDADMTVDDYVATSVEKYQFMAELNAPKPAPAAQATPAAQAAPAAQVTPAAQPTPAAAAQPPKSGDQ